MHLRLHPETFFKKDIFERLEWLKTCFDAFAHTPKPPKSIFLKRCFWTSVMVKNVFDAFAHSSRPPKSFFQKRCFWTSGVVKNAFWYIYAYFQTTKIYFSIKIILNVRSGWKEVLMHSRIPPDQQSLFFKKDVFERLEW